MKTVQIFLESIWKDRFFHQSIKGLMPEHLLISPDLELLKEYQEAAGGNIRYITVSPEVKGVPEAIKGMIESWHEGCNRTFGCRL